MVALVLESLFDEFTGFEWQLHRHGQRAKFESSRYVRLYFRNARPFAHADRKVAFERTSQFDHLLKE